jgi:hypothetical protein
MSPIEGYLSRRPYALKIDQKNFEGEEETYKTLDMPGVTKLV